MQNEAQEFQATAHLSGLRSPNRTLLKVIKRRGLLGRWGLLDMTIIGVNSVLGSCRVQGFWGLRPAKHPTLGVCKGRFTIRGTVHFSKPHVNNVHARVKPKPNLEPNMAASV